jgi:hypothetical protein
MAAEGKVFLITVTCSNQPGSVRSAVAPFIAR